MLCMHWNRCHFVLPLWHNVFYKSVLISFFRYFIFRFNCFFYNKTLTWKICNQAAWSKQENGVRSVQSWFWGWNRTDCLRLICDSRFVTEKIKSEQVDGWCIICIVNNIVVSVKIWLTCGYTDWIYYHALV